MTFAAFLIDNPAIPGFLGLGIILVLHIATGVWAR